MAGVNDVKSATHSTNVFEQKMPASLKSSHGPSQSTERAPPEEAALKVAESREDSYCLPLSVSDPTARDVVEGSSLEQMSKGMIEWEHEKIMTFKE